MSEYAKPVCRGSWALSTACGKCERCLATRPQPSAEPVADWLQECTDGRVSSHTITMLNAFRRWYDEYRVNPALGAVRREALEQAAKVARDMSMILPVEECCVLHGDLIADAIEALKENNNG